MTPTQAIKLLDHTLGQVNANRQTHEKIMEAIGVIELFITRHTSRQNLTVDEAMGKHNQNLTEDAKLAKSVFKEKS